MRSGWSSASIFWVLLPPRFGNWHTVYTRMNRWSKNGVLDRVFEHLQREQIVRIGPVSKAIIPDAQEHFLPLQHAATLIFSVDWGLDE